MTHNPNCDGDHCQTERGQVRVYPLGGSGNLILCAACWAQENRYRRERGQETRNPTDWPQVNWIEAEVYDGAR